jgi:hypothetical protein
MHTVTTPGNAVVARPYGGWNNWVPNRGNCAVALIFALLGICAAVGLGSGDWYVIEASWLNPTDAAFFPGSSFNTAVFGLRMGYYCRGPQSTIPFASNRANQGDGVMICQPYTYTSQAVYFQNVADDNNVPGSTQDDAKDRVTAFKHLIGSSSIIIALLAVIIVLAGLQFIANLLLACGWGSPFRTFPGKISLIVIIIAEALILIFWITIFPYKYFHDQEPNLALGAPRSYDVYHTLGLGFSIQVAGLIIGILSLFWYPRDVVIVKQTTTV